jgi:hypothetical protein
MKRTLVLVAALFLIGSLAAWAEGSAANPAVSPAPGGGSCALPDLAGLSPAQVALAALRAGIEMRPVDSVTAAGIPACPTTFACSSLPGCGSTMVCSLTAMGPCCTTGTAVLCCGGTGSHIFVERCPCTCVSEDCPRLCETSTQVTRSCS